MWGFSEFMGIRFGENNNDWRISSTLVGLACLVRWAALRRGHTSEKGEVLAALVLQVFGGVGAAWGMLEMLGLRTNYPVNCHQPQVAEGATFTGIAAAWGPGFSTCRNTYPESRIFCSFVGLWMLLRFAGYLPTGAAGRFEANLTTFLLEVCGGAGALWGVTEVAGPAGYSLRLGWGDKNFGQPSFDFWRIFCAATFMLCGVRVLMRHRATRVSKSCTASIDDPVGDRVAAADCEMAAQV